MNEIEVDARGLRCPLPVIRLAAAAQGTPAGTRITVLTSDPAARHDIPAWCRMRNHELIEITQEPDTAESDTAESDTAYLRFVVVIRSQSSNAAGGGSGSARSSRAT
ncbi:MAG: sulfurtransferase TusA family protein [Phycicoccus sp.]|nr:sulfurtransferase TusA family protein [Phycicoccus sp.]NMM33902.1 sulfurtransferase TusA family protein [Phycicoccus sp.]